MAPGGGGAHTGGEKETQSFVTSGGSEYFLHNMRKATPHVVSWEVRQGPSEGRTQAVAARRGPCEERDHPWGRVGVLEAVGQPSANQIQVKAEDTCARACAHKHTENKEKVRCDTAKHTEQNRHGTE